MESVVAHNVDIDVGTDANVDSRSIRFYPLCSVRCKVAFYTKASHSFNFNHIQNV